MCLRIEGICIRDARPAVPSADLSAHLKSYWSEFFGLKIEHL